MFARQLSRRNLLAAAIPAGALILAACGSPPAPTEAPKPAEKAAAPATSAPAATTAPAAAATKPAAAAATAAPAGATTAPAAAATAAPAAAAKPAGGQPVKLVWWGFSFAQPGAKAMNEDVLRHSVIDVGPGRREV